MGCGENRSDAARSWGGSAVLGVPPTRYCRGSHGANSGADAGSAHSPSPLAIAVVSPTRALHQDSEFGVTRCKNQHPLPNSTVPNLIQPFLVTWPA
ncbi:MAG: hypothetical protein F6K26_22005 [Moorea sp. SIO2I5]|nr:hypothetical protein [Moorena sp. SIO2I5]